jgi:hypothetical protein
LTKPLQGRMFIQFRDVLMGAVPMWYDVDWWISVTYCFDIVLLS